MAVRKRKLSKKQKEYFFDIRYKTLLEDGFTPEECDVLANVRMSRGGFFKIRRERKRMYQKYLDEGLSPGQAKDRIEKEKRKEEELIVDWDVFRRVIYPEQKKAALASA